MACHHYGLPRLLFALVFSLGCALEHVSWLDWWLNFPFYVFLHLFTLDFI